MAVTMNSGIIKMPATGDTLTMHCVKCEVVEGKFGEQVKFTAANGDALFLPRATADRQLGRIGFADGEMVLYSDVDNQTLIFTRDKNDKMPDKPYWSIHRVVKEDVSHRPSLTEQAKAEVARVGKAKGLVTEAENTIGKLPYDDEVPPPSDSDSPYNDEDGLPPVKATAHPKEVIGQSVKEDEYFALATRVAEFQARIGKLHECSFDLASINAMTFSIWKNS